MKKVFLLTILILGLLIVGCGAEGPEQVEVEATPTSVIPEELADIAPERKGRIVEHSLNEQFITYEEEIVWHRELNPCMGMQKNFGFLLGGHFLKIENLVVYFATNASGERIEGQDIIQRPIISVGGGLVCNDNPYRRLPHLARVTRTDDQGVWIETFPNDPEPNTYPADALPLSVFETLEMNISISTDGQQVAQMIATLDPIAIREGAVEFLQMPEAVFQEGDLITWYLNTGQYEVTFNVAEIVKIDASNRLVILRILVNEVPWCTQGCQLAAIPAKAKNS